MKTRTTVLARPTVWSLLAFALVALLAVGCGSSATPVPPSPAAAPAPTAAPASPTAAAPVPTSAPTSAPAAAPTTAAPEAAASGVSFAADIKPILDRSCVRCHAAGRGSGGLALDSYAGLMNGGNSGAAVVPGQATQSPLVRLVEQGKMPRGGNRLPQAEIDLLADWVNEGTKDN